MKRTLQKKKNMKRAVRPRLTLGMHRLLDQPLGASLYCPHLTSVGRIMVVFAYCFDTATFLHIPFINHLACCTSCIHVMSLQYVYSSLPVTFYVILCTREEGRLHENDSRLQVMLYIPPVSCLLLLFSPHPL